MAARRRRSRRRSRGKELLELLAAELALDFRSRDEASVLTALTEPWRWKRWKTMWFFNGKPEENHRKTRKTIGKLGKPQENHRKTIGKWRFTRLPSGHLLHSY